MIFYKVIIEQFTKGGEAKGRSRLCEEFPTLEEAVKCADEYRLSPLSIIEIRAYDRNRTIIMSDNGSDTGRLITRDISGIYNALCEEFQKANEDETFEGTMSHLITTIKDGVFKEWLYLEKPVNALHDDEVNDILYQYGDNDYVKCINGKLVNVE